MKLHTLMVAATLTGAAMLATPPFAWAADAAAHETVTPAFAEAIANVPGKKMTALVVDYAPGGKSSPHRHGQAFVVAYVLSGSIRSGVDGGEPRVFHAGEHWVEKPGAHHTVSENASATEPARLLAIFVADRNDNKLVTFDHQ
ncbi:cupin domain-containing protein [Burkholderia sp. WSM2232]|uniref:cupin domain-containing protein n=1 Tax=Burkholderia sp. WSM2232 TaxID=944436 RepID=UPI0004027807|nr:cupin domain-containing protein [Burkholderia sp. WSM2232]